jgi:hypothetical protein
VPAVPIIIVSILLMRKIVSFHLSAHTASCVSICAFTSLAFTIYTSSGKSYIGALPVGSPSLSVGTTNKALKASKSAQPFIAVSIVPLAVLTAVLYVLIADGIATSLSDFLVTYQSVEASLEFALSFVFATHIDLRPNVTT